MNVGGLFGLLVLGAMLIAFNMLTRRNLFDIPAIFAGFFCLAAAGYGFFKLAFG